MRLNSVMFFSLSSAMVMFTCVKAGCVGRDTEGEVLQRKKLNRYSEMHPAQASLGIRL
jgi:hypothetical protein